MCESLPSPYPQNVSYKAKAVKLESKADLVEVKEVPRCESEAEALGQTVPPPGAPAPPGRPRRLGDFALFNEAGAPEALDPAMLGKGTKVFVSGAPPRGGLEP